MHAGAPNTTEIGERLYLVSTMSATVNNVIPRKNTILEN